MAYTKPRFAGFSLVQPFFSTTLPARVLETPQMVYNH